MVSIWEKETVYAPQDVVIVGSGFVGLWSAYYLTKADPGLRITILERGNIPTGASTRNAGFACFGSLSELLVDAAAYGVEDMVRLAGMRYRGIQRIAKTFSKKEIDFQRCGGYELYDDATSADELLMQMESVNGWLREITGLQDSFTLADEELTHFGFGKTAHLVKTDLEGALHSGKLLESLIREVAGRGVRILTAVDVHGYVHEGDGVLINTSLPELIHSKQLLICTNAFARDLLPAEDIVPARGQVLLTAHIPDLPWQGTFHAEEGFYYFRNLGDRVLLGGARHTNFEGERTTDMDTSEDIQSRLETYLQEVVLPQHSGIEIEHCWSGIMAMGKEKMPIVKRVQPRVFCAVRMSGMGVALAPVVGKKVTNLMLQNEDD